MRDVFNFLLLNPTLKFFLLYCILQPFLPKESNGPSISYWWHSLTGFWSWTETEFTRIFWMNCNGCCLALAYRLGTMIWSYRPNWQGLAMLHSCLCQQPGIELATFILMWMLQELVYSFPKLLHQMVWIYQRLDITCELENNTSWFGYVLPQLKTEHPFIITLLLPLIHDQYGVWISEIFFVHVWFRYHQMVEWLGRPARNVPRHQVPPLKVSISRKLKEVVEGKYKAAGAEKGKYIVIHGIECDSKASMQSKGDTDSLLPIQKWAEIADTIRYEMIHKLLWESACILISKNVYLAGNLIPSPYCFGSEGAFVCFYHRDDGMPISVWKYEQNCL